MMSYDFSTTTHGKWILVGEHAVVRGHPALAFPLKDKTLHLSYQKSLHAVTFEIDSNDNDFCTLFLTVIEHGFKMLAIPRPHSYGKFYIQSNIPVGRGLGASAALCVAIARWFAAEQYINTLTIESFGRDLEHLFHGQSSGLDIATVATPTGIYFKNGIHTPLKKTWSPFWHLSSCDMIGVTSDCVNQVKALWKQDPKTAALIDEKMTLCVHKAHRALEDSEQSQWLLAEAMNEAADCFSQWGLITPTMHAHMQHLRDSGAIAVKPTGSGGGGYMVSLWTTEQL